MQTTGDVPINSFKPINSINLRHLDFDTIAYGSPHIDTLCKDLQITEDQLEEFLDAPATLRTLTLRRKLQSFQLTVKSLAAAQDAHYKLKTLLEHNNHGTARLAADRLLSLAGLEPPKPETHIHHHITSKPEPPQTKPAVFNGRANVPPSSAHAADPQTNPPTKKIENQNWKIENYKLPLLLLLALIATMALFPAKKAPPMHYRPFGSTDLNVSVIGLGTWQFGGEWGKNFAQPEVTAMLHRAKALGINFLDTAECYGDHLSEKLIGQALRDLNARDHFLIATKFGHRFLGHLQREEPRSAADTEKQLDDSLAALQTDHIDLYQYHSWPDEQFFNEDIHAVLLKAKAAGKIRHIGNSLAARPKTTRQVADAPKFNVEAIQLIYNRVTRFAEQEIFPLCQNQNLGVLARVPLASGLLSGKYKPGTHFPESDVRARQGPELDERLKEIEKIAAEELPPNIPMSQWALAWCLKHPAVSTVIPGCKSIDQLEQNSKAADLVQPLLTYRQASIEEISQLRFAILRPGMQPEIHHFPGDENPPPKTFHLGAFNSAGENIACLSLMESQWQNRAAYQLRGMAVASNLRKQGLGKQLLEKARTLVATHPNRASDPWWCNARVEAIGFYQKQKWKIASEEFLIEGVGPHVKMSRDWG